MAFLAVDITKKLVFFTSLKVCIGRSEAWYNVVNEYDGIFLIKGAAQLIVMVERLFELVLTFEVHLVRVLFPI